MSIAKRFSVEDVSNVLKLEFLLLDSLNFPWYLQPKTSSKKAEVWPDTQQLTHTFVYDLENNSDFTAEVLELLQWGAILERTGLDANIRHMKANLLLQGRNTSPHTPHYDIEAPHTVLLYYVNDCDGDTVFFNKTFGDQQTIDSTLKVVHRESPKGGDCVLFDGSIYHASCSPVTSNRRSVINFVLTT